MRYRHWRASSAVTASCMNAPIAGRGIAGVAPIGEHSQTRPVANSSQLSQVPHGVAPPAQLMNDPVRQFPAPTIAPSLANRT